MKDEKLMLRELYKDVFGCDHSATSYLADERSLLLEEERRLDPSATAAQLKERVERRMRAASYTV